jgi:hypothetical protein
MHSKQFVFRILKILCLFLPLYLFSFALQNYSLAEAQKVLSTIEKIKSAPPSTAQNISRRVIVTESELNSYIAYRIETEKEEIMKELRLKLFENNKIEGKIGIDLSKQKIPSFLKPYMTFYFAGKVVVEGGKVGLDLQELFLEGQPIQPMILDFIIFLAAKIENTEASSINDWYELPYGIKKFETHPGQLIVYY